MKKGEITSLIRNLLLGGGMDQNDSRLHPEVISTVVDAAIAQMLSAYLYQQEDIGPFLSAYNDVEIKTDENRQERYIDLPADIIQVPGALHTIAPMYDRKTPWSIIDAGQLAIYCNMDTSSATPIAYQEGSRVYFYNVPSTSKTVLVRMVSSVRELEDDDMLNIPQGRKRDLIDLTLEVMSISMQAGEDTVNDNTTTL